MKTIRNITAILFLSLCTTTAIAQPSNPDSPTPFGFVEVLLAAGAAYGGKKVYNARKKNEE